MLAPGTEFGSYTVVGRSDCGNVTLRCKCGVERVYWESYLKRRPPKMCSECDLELRRAARSPSSTYSRNLAAKQSPFYRLSRGLYATSEEFDSLVRALAESARADP